MSSDRASLFPSALPAQSILPADATTTARARLPRETWIDAVRGFLIVVMTVVHMSPPLVEYMFEAFGFFSVFEGFVFISGFLMGRATVGALDRAGVEPVMRRMGSRALGIYLVHAGLLAAVAAAATASASYRHYVGAVNPDFVHDVPGTFFYGLLLLNRGLFFDILPMYVVYSLLAPLYVVVLRRHGIGWGLALCAVLWLSAQVGLDNDFFEKAVGSPLVDLGDFDLLPWLGLSLLGMTFGYARATGRPLIGESRWLFAAALAVAVAGFLVRWQIVPIGHPDRVVELIFERADISPLRLINFLAVCYVVRTVARLHGAPLDIGALAPVGRHPLPCFAYHLICAYSVGLYLPRVLPALPFDATASGLAIVAVATFGLWPVAWAAARLRRRPAYSPRG